MRPSEQYVYVVTQYVREIYILDLPTISRSRAFQNRQYIFIAPPLSGLRMRTLSGGARNYVEKTKQTREGSNPVPSNSTYFPGGKGRRKAFRHFASSAAGEQGGRAMPPAGAAIAAVNSIAAARTIAPADKIGRAHV